MDKAKYFFLFIVVTFFSILCITVRIPRKTCNAIPKPRGPPNTCHFRISEQTITPLINTKHLLVSAYMDQRVKGFDIRIISIFRRDSIQPLYCLFCCAGNLSSTTPPTTILQHSDNFGFPFTTTDVMCQIPQNCNATHVSLLTEPDSVNTFNQTWLPIRNQKTKGKEEKRLPFNFTVCISTLFGEFNNVLQFAQTLEMYRNQKTKGKEEKKLPLNFTVCVSNLFGEFNNVLQFGQTLEMYRLLGVNRVVIYNTSCGPDLERLLQSYSQEGFVEMVPWPIDHHLKPSTGWLFSRHGGELHYYGQLTTLNECIYRSMDRSRYVLLNDIDEIIMPYQHNNLMSLMDMLQQDHPNTGVFLIENHIFPKKPFVEGKMGPLPQWGGVPGFNILERIYRIEPEKNTYNNRKMIVQPRMVQQTSVHEVLSMFGQKFNVPPDVCRMIHSKIHSPNEVPLEQLHEDTRLWDFKDKLVPSVNKVLRRAGLLTSEGQN